MPSFKQAKRYLPCSYKSTNQRRHRELLATIQRLSWRLVSMKFMRNIETLIESGLSRPIPWWERMKICGDSHLRRTSIPGDCVKELLFCAKIWSAILVILSNNFTWVTLCLRFFHVFFPHNGPKYQGHLSWHADDVSVTSSILRFHFIIHLMSVIHEI